MEDIYIKREKYRPKHHITASNGCMNSPVGVDICDYNGAYSGSSIADDNQIDCYYTGNIREPKVLMEDGKYYMLLGARKKNNQGAILKYESDDRISFHYIGEITTNEPFGYMWEYPSIFENSGYTVLCCCPKGVRRESLRFQNKYLAGYFLLEGRTKLLPDADETIGDENFFEWDYGFDFYAPYIFKNKDKDDIIIGWLGIQEMDEECDSKLSRDDGGWYSLSLPRVIKIQSGRLYQYPVKQFDLLRGKKMIDFYRQPKSAIDENISKDSACSSEDLLVENILNDVAGTPNRYGEIIFNIDAKSYDMNVITADGEFCRILLNNDFVISYKNSILCIEFLKCEVGRGRSIRRTKLDNLTEIRMIKDVSILEIYVNKGERVFTTKYFPDDVEKSVITFENIRSIEMWEI